MARNYINGDEVRFTRNDICSVDMEYYDGRKEENLEPRRLFPVSGLTRYITLLDSEGKEHAIIRDLRTLMPESRAVIEDCLREYYMVPKITAITGRFETRNILVFDVETDRGPHKVRIRNSNTDIKTLYDGRMLIRDESDNRYEIPDFRKLDRKSLIHLSSYI